MIITICIVVVIIILLLIVFALNKLCMFHPYIATMHEFQRLTDAYAGKMIDLKFNSTDGVILQGMLYNSSGLPSWDDIIFLYSHGNGGWIGNCLECKTVKFLSRFGSVFIYDYRGYGLQNDKKNIPNITENGLYDDITSAWNFLTTDLKIPPNKIVVVGHSLGASISSKLVANLVQTKKKKSHIPRALLLNAPFSTVSDVAGDIYPALSYLSVYGFNNVNNLKIINNKIPICTFHSKNDTLINNKHSKVLMEETKCKMIEISGGHNDPIYNNESFEYITKLLSN